MRLVRSLPVLLALAAPLMAQAPREKILVTPQWLNEHLNDKNLVILHLGPQATYDAAHIPGARAADIRGVAAPQVQGGLSLELPSVDSLRAALDRMGISDDSRIVLYTGPNTGFTSATRFMLTLDHAGFGDASSILDGGLAAWQRAGYKTTNQATTAAPGSASLSRTKSVTVPAEFVRDNVGKPGIALVDARAAVFYDGIQEGGPPDSRRKGHIKGAGSVPYTEVTDAQGQLKPAAELQALFDKAGVKPGDTVVGYCHIGLQATAMLFAARSLGYKVMLYDGSFEDWARKGWPVAVPPEK